MQQRASHGFYCRIVYKKLVLIFISDRHLMLLRAEVISKNGKCMNQSLISSNTFKIYTLTEFFVRDLRDVDPDATSSKRGVN